MAKGTVLFIDDDSFLRKVYQAELHDKGFVIELANDGEEGLQKIAQLKPDCVILDLIMPKKSGFEVLTELQREPELSRIPVIILSNLAQSDDQKRALDLGAVDYLVKDNTTLDIIAEKIEYHIHMSHTTPKKAASVAATKEQPTVKQVEAYTTPTAQSVTEPAVATRTQRSASRNFCPECGAKLEKNAKFCSQCGAQQF